MKGATKKKRGRPPKTHASNEQAKPNGAPKATITEQLFQCDDCIARLVMVEMQEHLAATGHTGYEPVEQNAELFSEPKPILRLLKVKLSDEELSDLYHQTGDIAVQLDDQRQAQQLAKDRIKALEVEQTKLAASLRDPYKRADVECEWHIDIEQNAKKLIRKDTGEEVETKPLSEEDRTAELARVQAANQQQQEKSAGATA